jgi:hypothetical protein
MTFLSPILLSGLLLASVPVIIHLLNRRRFRIVDWAPMKYLKLTIKTNRRRMRIEQLILLAVRTLVVIVLILAVARPVLAATGMGSWLGARGRTARLIVIDDSLSMGYQAGDRKPAFELAKDAARELVNGIKAQDSLTLIATSAPDDPLVRDAVLDDPSKATAAIAALAPGDARGDWAATLAAVDRHLAATAFPTREVVLVTDLRREGWGTEVTELANRWAAQSQAVNVKVVDVGTRSTNNVTLAGFDQQDPVALPGATVNLMATIRNDEPTPLAASQALLTIDGETRPVILPDLAPGSTTRVPLSVTLQTPGQHPLLLKLNGDALPADDGRWLNVNVRPSLNVTLVDGEPGARPFEGETDFLALSFTVGSVPWRVTRQLDAEWLAGGRDGDADVLVLANVAALTPERVTALEQLVREQGTGLMIFAGEQVDPQFYNDRLFKDGNGLLPARLEKASDEPVTGLVVESLDDSPLAALGKIAPAALGRIVAKRFMVAEPPPAAKSDSVRVLARWNDPEGRPAVIEKRLGRGRVLLWTITADRQWSDWPVDPTYVLAVRSAAMAVARPDGREGQATAGEPIRHRLPDGEQAAEPRVLAPGAAEAETASVEKSEGSAGVTIVHPRTSRAGVYTLKWKDATGAERSHTVAVNPHKAESDLTPITDAELADLLGNLEVPVIHYTAGETNLAGRGREIWKTFVIALLCLAAVETLLATWVGRER